MSASFAAGAQINCRLCGRSRRLDEILPVALAEMAGFCAAHRHDGHTDIAVDIPSPPAHPYPAADGHPAAPRTRD